MNAPLWHLLQISDVLDTEFASALAESVPVLAWKPQRTLRPGRIAPGSEAEPTLAGMPVPLPVSASAGLRVRNLPLMPGFARLPLRFLAPIGRPVAERLLRHTPDPERSPLICSTPFFAPVAERWPGPVIYWLTDLIAAYPSADRRTVERLDRRLCRVATVVAPNSRRLERYLIDRAGCDPGKIEIVPNATRAANILPRAPLGPGARPPVLARVARPIAGVIGNMAGNLDWALLRAVVAATPSLQWVFVGPTSMPIADLAQRRARTEVIAMPNTQFVGKQPYGELVSFARCFDVAVLPYLRSEPTYSGSSTRFYEHLAACRPMIATRGLEELNRKTPLLKLVDTPAEMLAELERLAELGFDDGLAELRWRASLNGTWQSRATTVRSALAARVPVASRSGATDFWQTLNA